MRQLITYLLLLVIFVGYIEMEEEIIYVQAIWRHGDRAPNNLPYPIDRYTETSWPRGWGQLTNNGIMQMYQLGEYFRKRYASFIKKFNATEIQMVSSKSNRAITSALAVLRGFFPASNQEIWLQDELWQPLPFAIDPNDAMLKPTDFNCPKYDIRRNIENDKLKRSIKRKYEKFFAFLANMTGQKNMDFKKAASLHDIQREIYHNLTQPTWVYHTWPEFNNQRTIDIINELKRIYRIFEFNSPIKAQMRGGLLMGDWINTALKVSSGFSVTPTKIKLYSSHDGTVLALMYAFGIGNDLLVPYASCLFMEIYQTDDNQKILKMFYKNGTTEYQMALPGCPSHDNCTIKDLEKAIIKRKVINVEHLKMVRISSSINNDNL
ncbi:unnamed protein product [Thelazia callipaeda]|uniref:Venom acid phosphatase Acph-1-like n=1 Tax=Thelazia callipaeda TaxID=103827 RepID=A0A0N5CY86_THECL|nr:unnamed protein product [Thelazia callipaeda]